ncbi:MAG: AbrB/MazE/SpoVT family DNA-binding domain-containing protein [Candidatus Woesearchaeota archaeon]|nr:AbrB/MazE/SpoVT family DNA-binding domain-containing protein [Candidatus Woesearchaeota archaeon]
MKQFMKTCYECNIPVKKAVHNEGGVALNCLLCPKCGEKYFVSSEIVKWEILSGKRKNIRKFGTLGDSTIIRLPQKILEQFSITAGDYGLFEKHQDGILVKPVHAKELQ